MTTFGQRLRTLRLAAGLSQSELAGEDLSASYVSLMEAGKRTPSSDVIHQLTRRLGCSPTQLMDGGSSEREDRMNCEVSFARLAIEHGEAAEARRRLEQLVSEEDLSRRLYDEIVHLLGVACDRSGDLISAIRVLLPLFERACSGDTHLIVSLLGLRLCGCYQDAGDLIRAVEVGERAIAASREQGLADTDDFLRLCATTMWAYVERGDAAHARVMAEQLLPEAQASGSPAGQASLYWNLGALAAKEGRVSAALKLYEQALGRLSELDNTRDFARLRLSIAGVFLSEDPPRTATAMDLLRRCADDVQDLGGPLERAEWHWEMAVVLLHLGELDEAEKHARDSAGLSVGSPVPHADALQVLSDILAARGNSVESFQALLRAQDALGETGPSRKVASEWRKIAERLTAHDSTMAIAAFRQALEAAGVRDRSVANRRQATALRSRRSVPADRP